MLVLVSLKILTPKTEPKTGQTLLLEARYLQRTWKRCGKSIDLSGEIFTSGEPVK